MTACINKKKNKQKSMIKTCEVLIDAQDYSHQNQITLKYKVHQTYVF